jgi:hypothetical protein
MFNALPCTLLGAVYRWYMFRENTITEHVVVCLYSIIAVNISDSTEFLYTECLLLIQFGKTVYYIVYVLC